MYPVESQPNALTFVYGKDLFYHSDNETFESIKSSKRSFYVDRYSIEELKVVERELIQKRRAVKEVPTVMVDLNADVTTQAATLAEASVE